MKTPVVTPKTEAIVALFLDVSEPTLTESVVMKTCIGIRGIITEPGLVRRVVVLVEVEHIPDLVKELLARVPAKEEPT